MNHTPMDFLRDWQSKQPNAWNQLLEHVREKRSEFAALQDELQLLQIRINKKKEQIEIAKDKLIVLQKNRLQYPKK